MREFAQVFPMERGGGFESWSRDDGLLNDFILGIEPSSSGVIYLGTDGGGDGCYPDTIVVHRLSPRG